MTVRPDYSQSRARYTPFHTRWALGDAAGTAQRIIDTLPQLSRHAPVAPGSWIFLTWRFWAAVGLVLALVALKYVEQDT